MITASSNNDEIRSHVHSFLSQLVAFIGGALFMAILFNVYLQIIIPAGHVMLLHRPLPLGASPGEPISSDYATVSGPDASTDDAKSWPTQVEQRLLHRLQPEVKAEQFIYPYAFGMLVDTPLNWGRVLEFSDISWSLLDVLLDVQQRTVSSIVRCNPLWPFFKRNHKHDMHASSTVKERTIDELSGDAEYDTVIVHDAMLSSPDRVSVLKKLLKALVPGGQLILTAPMSKVSNSSSTKPSFFNPNEPLSEADLDWLLDKMSVQYRCDEEFLQRAQWLIADFTFPTTVPRVFVIATKLPNEVTSSLPTYSIKQVQAPADENPTFYLVWSSSQLKTWRLAVIDSIFLHHPRSRIIIVSNELHNDSSPLQPFLKLGYSLKTMRCDYHEIFADTPILSWIQSDSNRENANSVSEAVRLALLWKHGGVYIDFDAIVLRPFNFVNVLARESPNGLVSNAVLPFRAKHPFLHLLMIFFVRRATSNAYMPALQTYGTLLYQAMHADLVRHLVRPSAEDQGYWTNGVTVYQPQAFFTDVVHPRYWIPAQIVEHDLEATMNGQYIIHHSSAMHGGALQSETDYINLESVVGRMFMKNCKVLCEMHREKNQNVSNVNIPNYSRPVETL